MAIQPSAGVEPSEIELSIVRNSELTALCDVLRSTATEEWEDVLRRPEFQTPGIRVFSEAVRGNLNPTPIRSILKIAVMRYNCFAVIEYPHFDLEVWGGYTAFYARCFVPYERLCRRVHFLDGSEDNGSDFVRKLTAGMEQ